MLLQQEAKEIMGNIFLVHRNNHADVFKVSNMEKYIFKRYIFKFGRYIGNKKYNTVR